MGALGRAFCVVQGVRQKGVAQAVGAPSGSMYHPEEALLLHGAGEFGRADWAEEYVRRADFGNERVFGSLGALAASLGVAGPRDRERVTLALVDLPLSVVRRHLRAGEPLPAHAEECAAALLYTA
ncbi:hypothetical protein ACFWBN_25195 [Streptomyces sp. NPDC059989]|uniref:hypothetical protein n=1 Tax=Streptomyces sp. NPDC059989 TaxID=3347026 RepID=UPI0036A4EDAB